MRLRPFIYLALITAALSVPDIQSQSVRVGGPILGFTSDGAGTRIWPIIGVPGASTLIEHLEVETAIHGVIVSPKQDYALAVRSEDARIVLIDLRPGKPATLPIGYIPPGVDVMATSPTGSAAAVYNYESGTIQTIRGLPDAPELLPTFDTAHIAGRATALAVSDNGAVAFAQFAEPESDRVRLWLFNSSPISPQVISDGPSEAAFFPRRLDAVIGEDSTHSAFLLLDIAHEAIRVPLISVADNDHLSKVFASDDGRVFLADADSGKVTIVDTTTTTSTVVSCGCQIAGLYPLKGSSIFRLSDVSREPALVLDASADEPRIVVIPPNLSIQ